MMRQRKKKDCGCGGGKNCITKSALTKFVRSELKRLDCGCGCKGEKGFCGKYGMTSKQYVGGNILMDCPPGWRNDGLTCVENCKDDEKDDGLTCRKKCAPGQIDDGLTCRNPITSSMNECPSGSRDVAGTCWGVVRKDCVDDCFKHPAPGCRTYECGRVRGLFNEDLGPKLCTDCNLRCGQTCWDVQGITKQLHERNLRVMGGEVFVQNIRGKQIRGRIDFSKLEEVLMKGLADFFEGRIDLLAAFDPEKNGINAAFRKFGDDINAALNEIENKIKDGFKKMGDAARKAFEQLARDAETKFKQFGADFVAKMKDPDFWVEFSAILTEVALYAAATLATATGVGAAFAPGLLAAAAMAGPAIRMIAAGIQGQPIDILDIALIAAEGALAAVPGLGPFASKAVKVGANAAKIVIACVKLGQAYGAIPETCVVNCPTPPENPPKADPPLNPPLPPQDPPPAGQKSDTEILDLAPPCTFIRVLNNRSKPDECKRDPRETRDGPPYYTEDEWIAKYRLENYGADNNISGPGGELTSPDDADIADETNVEVELNPVYPGDTDLKLDEDEPVLDLNLDELPTLDLTPDDDEPILDLNLGELPTLDLNLDSEPTLDLTVTDEPILDLNLSELPTLDLTVTDEPILDLNLGEMPILDLAELEGGANVESMQCYLENNRDLLGPLNIKDINNLSPADLGQLQSHYNEYGKKEGRSNTCKSKTSVEDLPLIEVKEQGDTYSNPFGNMASQKPKANIPNAHTGEPFNVDCYIRKNPEVASAAGNDKDKITTHWIEIGSKNGFDASCGPASTREEILKKMEEQAKKEASSEAHKVVCAAADKFWDQGKLECDGTRHADGRNNAEAALCKQQGSHWETIGSKSFCNKWRNKDNNIKSKKELCNTINGYYANNKCDLSKNVDGTPKNDADYCVGYNNFYDPKTNNCDIRKDREGRNKSEEEMCRSDGNYWGVFLKIVRSSYHHGNSIDTTEQVRSKVRGNTLPSFKIQDFLKEFNIGDPFRGRLKHFGITYIDNDGKEKSITVNENETMPEIKSNHGTPGCHISHYPDARIKGKQSYCQTTLHGTLRYNRYCDDQLGRFPTTYGQMETVLRDKGRMIAANEDKDLVRIKGNAKPSKSLTFYYANWCPHCKPLIPMFKALKVPGVQIRMLEEAENNEFKVEGYPTIVYRDGKSMEKYNGPRTKSGIVNFLKNKL